MRRGHSSSVQNALSQARTPRSKFTTIQSPACRPVHYGTNMSSSSCPSEGARTVPQRYGEAVMNFWKGILEHFQSQIMAAPLRTPSCARMWTASFTAALQTSWEPGLPPITGRQAAASDHAMLPHQSQIPLRPACAPGQRCLSALPEIALTFQLPSAQPGCHSHGCMPLPKSCRRRDGFLHHTVGRMGKLCSSATR